MGATTMRLERCSCPICQEEKSWLTREIPCLKQVGGECRNHTGTNLSEWGYGFSNWGESLFSRTYRTISSCRANQTPPGSVRAYLMSSSTIHSRERLAMTC